MDSIYSQTDTLLLDYSIEYIKSFTPKLLREQSRRNQRPVVGCYPASWFFLKMLKMVFK